MVSILFRWYYFTGGFFLFQTIGAFAGLDRLLYGEWDNKSGDKLTQGLTLLAIIAGLSLFLHAYKGTKCITTGAMLAIALAAFLALSSVWSLEPQFSARRGIQYLFFILGVIGLVNTLDGDKFLGLVGDVCLLSALISLGLMVVSPGLANMPNSTDLRGVFAHKSVLGQAMETGALMSLYRIRENPRKMPGIAMLLVFTVTTIAAKSMTSLLTIVVYSCAELIIVLVRRGGASRLLGLGSIVLLMPVIVVAMVFPDQILEMLGKDPTLTGRSELWGYVIQFIAYRPVLGWGLGAFWSPSNPLAVGVSESLGWIVPQSHNGLLEMLLEVGAVGTIFFLIIICRNVMIAFRTLATAVGDIAISLLLCVGGILLVGITEGILLDPAEPALSIFFGMGLICERALRAGPQRRMVQGRATRPTTARSLPQQPLQHAAH